MSPTSVAWSAIVRGIRRRVTPYDTRPDDLLLLIHVGRIQQVIKLNADSRVLLCVLLCGFVPLWFFSLRKSRSDDIRLCSIQLFESNPWSVSFVEQPLELG